MLVRRFVATALLGLAACSSRGDLPPNVFTPTQDPLTRLVPAEADAILAAGTAALTELGLSAQMPTAGAEYVWSEPVLLQSIWQGGPVSDRVVCGVGTAAASDPIRLRTFSNTIPIELRLGFSVEPRFAATAASVIFTAEGRRTGVDAVTTPRMSCTLTVPFVNELFVAIQRHLEAGGA